MPRKNFYERHLLIKSKEAFLLAVEIFNKPTIKYKIEGFSFFIVNAWELLLKHFLIKNNGYRSIFYKTDPDRTLSADDCIRRIFPNQNNKIRMNLEEIISIRNKATHLIIPEFNIIYEPLFQSCVFNYLNFACENTNDGDFVKLKLNPIIVHSGIYDSEYIKRTYGKTALEMFNNAQEHIVTIQESASKDDDLKDMFFPIIHTFSFTKNENKASIRAYYDNSGKPLRSVTVAKDMNESHPYGYKELCIKIRCEHPELNFNSTILSRIRNRYNIIAKPEYYFYVKKTGTKVYSPAFYEFLVAKLTGEQKEEQPQGD